jgi:membrane protein
METEPDRGPNLAGWNLAAALGLLAAAFLIERLSPPKDQGFSERKTKRETSTPRLMADGNERGRVAASLQRSPLRDGRTSCCACIPTLGTIAFWHWLPA